MPRIELVRVERTSDYNAKLRAEGKKRGIIYDFDIILDGVKKGEWSCCDPYGTWHLYDEDDAQIMHPTSNQPITTTQKLMLFATENAVSYFPTAARLAERRENRRVAQEALLARERAARAEHNLTKAAPTMRDALKQCKALLAELCGTYLIAPQNETVTIINNIIDDALREAVPEEAEPNGR